MSPSSAPRAVRSARHELAAAVGRHAEPQTQTLPSAIYTFTQIPGGDAGALRLTAISVAISLAALMASEVLARRVGRRIAA